MRIAGEDVESHTGAHMTISNPATDESLDQVPAGDAEDVDRAVQAAAQAFKSWSQMDTTDRAEALFKAITAVEEEQDKILTSLTAEQGKPPIEAAGEFRHFIGGLRYYAELATKDRGAYQPVPSTFGPAYSLITRRPIGVVGAIVPWNFPLTLLANKLGPALVTGNTVVVKPADSTPLTTLLVVSLLESGGLPPGVVNVVTGTGPAVGEALVAHPLTRRIAFTGQSSTGQRVASVAAPMLKRLSLELGGSDPTIVFPDADLDRAVKTIAIGRYWNAGQVCLAPKRAIVFDDVYDEFMERMKKIVSRYEPGNGAVKAEKPKIRMGPLHTRAQYDRVRSQLVSTLEQGAKLTEGEVPPEDPGAGNFFPAALVENVPRDSALAQEEVFGPVLPVFRVASTEEAIEVANDTPFGLGGSVWSFDSRNIHAAMRSCHTGILWVNQLHYGYDEVPFGGTKNSGSGKEHGIEALHEYTEVQSVIMGGF